jgi:hypothetical protein
MLGLRSLLKMGPKLRKILSGRSKTMGIQIGGLTIDVPANPLQVPDPTQIVNGLDSVAGQLATEAKKGLEAAKTSLANLAGAYQDDVLKDAKILAVQYNQNGGNNFDDCVPIVLSGLAFIGTKKGGAWGAAIGAGGGYYAARIACRP